MTSATHRIFVLALASLTMGVIASPAAAQPQPSTGTVQGAPTPAPMSATDMLALFKEKAALGAESDKIQEQLKPLAAEGEKLQADQTKLDQDRKTLEGRWAAGHASCDGHDWSQSAYSHCSQLQIDLNNANDTFNTSLHAHQAAADAWAAKATPMTERLKEVDARLKAIEALLKAQQAFASANSKCGNEKILETAVQCMQIEWDRASPQTVIIPDPPGMMRTPEQAIEEYKKSGPPTPLIRPKGGGREPPPPPPPPPAK
jgi:hypothetical protein